MPLKGSIGDFSLPDLFQLIQFGKKNGTLNITNGDARGYVCFRKGKVFFATYNWKKPQLGQSLLKAGAISEDQLEEALDLQKSTRKGQRLGNILVELGYLSRESLEERLTEQIKDAVFHLLQWAEGDFFFDPNQMFPDEDIGVSMSAENVIMEGSRRLDEWHQIEQKVPSLAAVFKMDKAPDRGTTDINLNSEEWSVLYHVDGHTTVRGIIKKSGQSSLVACKALFGLVTAGLITQVAGGEPEISAAAGLEVEINEFESAEGVEKGRGEAPDAVKLAGTGIVAAVNEEPVQAEEEPETVEEEPVEMPVQAEEEPETVEEGPGAVIAGGTGVSEEEVEKAARRPLLRKSGGKRRKKRKVKKGASEGPEEPMDVAGPPMETSTEDVAVEQADVEPPAVDEVAAGEAAVEEESAEWQDKALTDEPPGERGRAAVPDVTSVEEPSMEPARESKPAPGQSLVDYYKSMAIEEATDAERLSAYRDTEEKLLEESSPAGRMPEMEEAQATEGEGPDEDLREPEEIPLEWRQHLNRLRGVYNVPTRKHEVKEPAEEPDDHDEGEGEQEAVVEAPTELEVVSGEYAVEDVREAAPSQEPTGLDLQAGLIAEEEAIEIAQDGEPAEELTMEVSGELAGDATVEATGELTAEVVTQEAATAEIAADVTEEVTEELTAEVIAGETSWEPEFAVPEDSADGAELEELAGETEWAPEASRAAEPEGVSAYDEVSEEIASIEESAALEVEEVTRVLDDSGVEAGPLPLEDEIERLLQDMPRGREDLSREELLAFDQPTYPDVEARETRAVAEESEAEDEAAQVAEALASDEPATGAWQEPPAPVVSAPEAGEETSYPGTVLEFAEASEVQVVEVFIERPEPVLRATDVNELGIARELQIPVMAEPTVQGASEVASVPAEMEARMAVGADNEATEIPLVLEVAQKQAVPEEEAVPAATVVELPGIQPEVEDAGEIALEGPVAEVIPIDSAPAEPVIAEELDVEFQPVDEAAPEEEPEQPAADADRVTDVPSGVGTADDEIAALVLEITETEAYSQEGLAGVDLEEVEALRELVSEVPVAEEVRVVEEVVVIPEMEESEVLEIEEEIEENIEKEADEDGDEGFAESMQVGGRRTAGTSLIDLETFELERELLELAGTRENRKRIPLKDRSRQGDTKGKKGKKGGKDTRDASKGKRGSTATTRRSVGAAGKSPVSGAKSRTAKEVDKGSIKKIIDELKKM